MLIRHKSFVVQQSVFYTISSDVEPNNRQRTHFYFSIAKWLRELATVVRYTGVLISP